FLELALELGVLLFGEFKLKSGRVSPYFFNAGLFNSGYAAAKIGRCYASAITSLDLEFDMLFGAAYKAIPIVALAAAALAEHHDFDYPFAYNRKEAKDHGEGGITIGAPIAGRVLILDDVITAGTAVREVLEIIRAAGGPPAARPAPPTGRRSAGRVLIPATGTTAGPAGRGGPGSTVAAAGTRPACSSRSTARRSARSSGSPRSISSPPSSACRFAAS